jgi:hypothetical protein
MKKLLSLLTAAFLTTAGFAQNAPGDGHNHDAQVANPQMAKIPEVLLMKESVYDFTQIPQGKPVYHNFLVVNMGSTPLTLADVHASCGCTTPEWSRTPIAPGATAVIRVGYNAANVGFFEKFITVTYNTDQTKQIKITGTVWKAPEGSAPVNESIDFLKKQTL